MKLSNVKSQERKKTIWDYLSRHFGKSFWIMTIWCVSCAPTMSIPAMLPVTGGEAKANIVASPEYLDFGIRELNSVSMAKKVTIRNDGAEPLLINKLTATAGFFIVANTCLRPQTTIAQGDTCNVEIVFKPNMPRIWVGELQIEYASNQFAVIPLRGSAEERFLADVSR